MDRIRGTGLIVMSLLVTACTEEFTEERAETENVNRTAYEELQVAADTAAGFEAAGRPMPVVPTQGASVEAPLTAMGTLQDRSANGNVGGVTITEAAGGGSRVLILVRGYDPNAQLTARIERGNCDQVGQPVEEIGTAFSVGAEGIGEQEATVAIPTEELLSGVYAVAVTTGSGAGSGERIACSALPGAAAAN